MPGLLRPDARCPMCLKDLTALADETSSSGVRRIYYHEPGTKNCVVWFSIHVEARVERAMLEAKTEKERVN